MLQFKKTINRYLGALLAAVFAVSASTALAAGPKGPDIVVVAQELNRSFVQQAGGVLTDNQGGMSTIIATDVPAANGVIHAISAVLMP